MLDPRSDAEGRELNYCLLRTTNHLLVLGEATALAARLPAQPNSHEIKAYSCT